jgi:1-deoxy-D-xylulose-5-phosphate synthase
MDWQQPFEAIELGVSRPLSSGTDVAILSLGAIGATVQELIIKEQLDITHVDLRFLKPLDKKTVDLVFQNHKHVITIEDGTIVGGMGSVVMDHAFAKAYKGTIHKLGLPDSFIEHGPTADLQKIAGFDRETILELINKLQSLPH